MPPETKVWFVKIFVFAGHYIGAEIPPRLAIRTNRDEGRLVLPLGPGADSPYELQGPPRADGQGEGMGSTYPGPEATAGANSPLWGVSGWPTLCAGTGPATVRRPRSVIMRRIIGLLSSTVLVVAFATACGGKQLLHTTERSLLSAINRHVPQELAGRGHQFTGRLACARQPGSRKESIRVRCTGATKTKKPVIVLASIEEETEDEFFTILVDGRPVVQNVRCLAQDCKRLKED